MEAVLFILKTGCCWRDLPREYGAPVTAWRRLRRLDAEGVWQRIWHTALALLDAQVQGAVDTWVRAFNGGDAAGVANKCVPDGEHVVGRPVAGRTAIQDAITRGVWSTDFAVADRRFGVVGDRAWETGVAMQTITPESGQPHRLIPNYVALLACQPDGSWKIQTLMAGNQRQQPIR